MFSIPLHAALVVSNKHIDLSKKNSDYMNIFNKSSKSQSFYVVIEDVTNPNKVIKIPPQKFKDLPFYISPFVFRNLKPSHSIRVNFLKRKQSKNKYKLTVYLVPRNILSKKNIRPGEILIMPKGSLVYFGSVRL